MKARRTPWWHYVLAAMLGLLAGLGFAKYGEITGLPLVGAPWVVPVVLIALGIMVLVLALQVHKYTTKDPLKRAQLKPLDPQKAFGVNAMRRRPPNLPTSNHPAERRNRFP